MQPTKLGATVLSMYICIEFLFKDNFPFSLANVCGPVHTWHDRDLITSGQL